MKKKYLITIDGLQFMGESGISLSTLGEFRRENDNFFISYRDFNAINPKTDITSFEIESNNKVTLNRRGINNSQLVIERNQKHHSYYRTDNGDAMVGVTANSIINRLNDNGGTLSLSYSLDINLNELYQSSLEITVKEI